MTDRETAETLALRIAIAYLGKSMARFDDRANLYKRAHAVLAPALAERDARIAEHEREWLRADKAEAALTEIRAEVEQWKEAHRQAHVQIGTLTTDLHDERLAVKYRDERAETLEEENRKLREALREAQLLMRVLEGVALIPARFDEVWDLRRQISAVLTIALTPASPAPAESEPAKVEACPHCAAGHPYKSQVGSVRYHIIPDCAPGGWTYARCAAHEPPESATPARDTRRRCRAGDIYSPSYLCNAVMPCGMHPEPIASPNLATAADGWTAPTEEP